MKNVQITLTRAQAQALVALLSGNLTTGELRPLEGVDRCLVAEAFAALMDSLTANRPVVRWQSFRDDYGPGHRLLCDGAPIAVARAQYNGDGYRCILVATGAEPARLGVYPSLREARAVALAEFTSRARQAAAAS